MDRRLLLALFSVLLVSVTVYAVMNDSDESDAATADDVRVFIERADGTYAETIVSGTSVKQIIENACNSLDMRVVYNRLGMITSVGGTYPSGDEYWNIHQWMPLGNHDWATVGYDVKSDSQVISGTSYCLHMSSQEMINGTNQYMVPDFKPESDGYVFIRFDYAYDNPDSRIQDAFTVEDRINGFWIKGHGCNMGEVVENAMESNGFEAQFLINKDSNGNDLQYWITSFFGIEGDTKIGENSYIYWSQYAYIDDKWTYNSWTLGYYDPAVYKYIGMVYIVSLNYADGEGEEQNVLTTLPDVTDTQKIADAVKHRRILTATFEIDGEVLGENKVGYGAAVRETPAVPGKEGYYFSGWGDTTELLTEDKVFHGRYIDKGDSHVLVTYRDDNGNPMFVQALDPGSVSDCTLVPSRKPTVAEEYIFDGWSADGDVLADLSSVTTDLSVTPLFHAKPMEYPVIFKTQDGSEVCRIYVEYGKALTDIPTGPFRSPTVDKVYTFAGWAVALYSSTKMDEGLLADLSSITSSKVVFAAYTYKAHPYTLTVHVEGSSDLTYDITYGGFLIEDMMTASVGGNLLRFYRDPSMTQEVGTSFMFTGDTTLYARKVAGTYTYTDESRTTVTVELEPSDIQYLEHNGSDYLVADISGFADGKTVLLGRSEISKLGSALGDDAFISVELHRGRIAVNLGDLASALGLRSGTLNGISDGTVEFSISKGPTSSVRINSSLKNVNWDDSYTVTMKIDGKSVTDPASRDIRVRVTVPYEYDETVSPRVWSANPNTGVLTSVPCSYSEGTVTFGASSLLYYFTGTSGPRSSQTDDRDYCPYGKVDYDTYGSDKPDYNSTLNRMDINCHGEVLMVPSSLEGFALWTIGPDAFSGVLNASAIVVPASVRNFDWTSLYNTQVKEVYFLGDLPVFTGEAPAYVSVYYSDKASGWSSTPYGIVNIGTYSRGGFSLQYCLVDEQVIIVKWVKGAEVDIPSYINVNGTEYPVTVIGCNAFEESTVTHVRIPDTVREVQTRAFYYCSSLEELSWGSAPSVKVLADECFRACFKLRSSTIMIPDGTRFIGFEAFRECLMIRSLYIPNSVTDMREGAFRICSSMENLTLSNGLTAIPDRCFNYCNRLDGVVIPDTVTTIGLEAFDQCDVLTYINLNNVAIVDTRAFYDCQNLVSVTLGKPLKVLGKDCFGSNAMLTEIIAYCTQPEGYEACGLSSEAVLYANYDVAGGWNADHQVIEKEDDLKRSFEAETMPYVVGAMIVIMIGLAIATVIYRRRCLL
ncbi:MAG: leucine-rich repeat domain-containing protein [archaeon]|nr:leucine-rich repeat domain-containing protein [archaeon]